MNATPETKVAISPDVISQEIFFGETLLLDVKTLVYFGLDALGTRIWELLQERGSLQSVLGTLQRESDLEAGVLEQKFEGIINGLRHSGLISVKSAENDPETA